MKPNKVMPGHRNQIVLLRQAGETWPKIAKAVGFSRATVQKVYKEEKEKEELPVIEDTKPKYEKARVLSMVPNPRLMRIYFEDREEIAICVKRPQDNHPPKSQLLVKKVEGEEKLYRLV
jgi:predicted transcriptional regulator